jgi:hypothetical protein
VCFLPLRGYYQDIRVQSGKKRELAPLLLEEKGLGNEAIKCLPPMVKILKRKGRFRK